MLLRTLISHHGAVSSPKCVDDHLNGAGDERVRRRELVALLNANGGVASNSREQPFLVYKKQSLDQFIDAFVAALNEQANKLGVRPIEMLVANEKLPLTGAIVEFGVYTGGTVKLMANKYENRLVWGFDGFAGLPEKWGRHPSGQYAVTSQVETLSTIELDDLASPGAYDGVELKKVDSEGENSPTNELLKRLVRFKTWSLPNVRLVKGWFSDSLPSFEQAVMRTPSAYDSEPRIALLHADADLYSSTYTIFTFLGDYLDRGSLVVFDELVNYPSYRDHEIKALYELVARRRLEFEIIGALNGADLKLTRERQHEEQSVAIRIL